jgi:hypothetical protein
MSDGGKGSKQRPFSVSQEEYADNWNRVFKPVIDKYSDISKNDYQDILSTEDCIIDAFENKEGC